MREEEAKRKQEEFQRQT